MTSMMVVVSKAVFSKMKNAEGETPGLGDVLKHRRYESRHRSLDQLTSNGALFLVTARPNDRLWLLAILDKPKADDDGWQGRWNQTPITDITKLVKQLKLNTGKGIDAKPGKLGMSLQTPRVLADVNVALLRGAVGEPTRAKSKAQSKAKPAKKSKAKPTKKTKTRSDVSSIAEARADLAIRVPDARHIATLSAWKHATAAQRTAAAKAIEKAGAEAEHEHAQRGLAESELTWDGHVIPDEKWFVKARKKKNDFGLEQMGFMPEICGDVFHPDHGRAPKSGIRKGKGPRVVRGGAAMLYPWQGCGEWHLLLNAFRASSKMWEFELSMRPAIGVR